MKYDNLAISMWNGATTQHEYVFIMRRDSAVRHRLALALCNLPKQNATVHKKCTKSQRSGALGPLRNSTVFGRERSVWPLKSKFFSPVIELFSGCWSLAARKHAELAKVAVGKIAFLLHTYAIDSHCTVNA